MLSGALQITVLVLLGLHHASTIEVVKDLKFLTVLFRHGYRATAYQYKNDPYGEKIWPGGFSSLTTRGVKQHFTLGQYLGRRYEGYVDPQRAVREVYVRSTNYDRTLQSASANMAGWFPPTAKDVWDNTALANAWRPFPVRLADDPSLLGEADCETIDSYDHRPDLQALFNELEQEHKEFLDFVRVQAGEPNLKISKGLEQVSDVLRTQRYAGFAPPSWVTEDVYNKIQYLDDLRFHIWVGGNGDVQRARVNGGRLMDHILKNFEDKIANKSDAAKRKVYAYASHDNAIGGLLSVLDLYDYDFKGPVQHIPLYANTLFFELYQDNTVRVLYKNDTTVDGFEYTDPMVLKHPQCDVYCPLSRLLDLTKQYRPTDWKSECEGTSGQTFPVLRPIRSSGNRNTFNNNRNSNTHSSNNNRLGRWAHLTSH